MFDTIFGLPVHVLVIHAVVVLVPLSALGVAAMAVVPSWRDRFGPAVLVIATVALVAVPVATRSGRELKARIGAQGVVAEQIERHQSAGNLVIWPTLAMWLLAIVLFVLHRRSQGASAAGAPRRGRLPVTVVAVLAIIAAGAAGVQVTIAGHRGSTAVWSCTIGSDACR